MPPPARPIRNAAGPVTRLGAEARLSHAWRPLLATVSGPDYTGQPLRNRHATDLRAMKPSSSRDDLGRERWTIHFSGTVQGVGFRYATQRIASALAVTGYVKNLSDGRVELVAEGSAVELARLLAGVQSAMDGHIRSFELDKTGQGAEFSRFEIRH